MSLFSETFVLLLSQKKQLKRHIDSVHEGEKLFQCNTCGSRLTQNTNLKVHIATVHDANESFQCTICDSFFAEKKHGKNTLNQIMKKISFKSKNPQMKNASLLFTDKNPGPSDSEGYTPLHWADQNGNFEACKLLIENIKNM